MSILARLKGDDEIEKLLARAAARRAEQCERLAANGLLLTPSGLRALGELEFDAFSISGAAE